MMTHGANDQRSDVQAEQQPARDQGGDGRIRSAVQAGQRLPLPDRLWRGLRAANRHLWRVAVPFTEANLWSTVRVRAALDAWRCLSMGSKRLRLYCDYRNRQARNSSPKLRASTAQVTE